MLRVARRRVARRVSRALAARRRLRLCRRRRSCSTRWPRWRPRRRIGWMECKSQEPQERLEFSLAGACLTWGEPPHLAWRPNGSTKRVHGVDATPRGLWRGRVERCPARIENWLGQRSSVEAMCAQPSRTSERTSELLERASLLSALGEFLAAVRSESEGRLVVVAGEAGVGKTTLLRRFCDEQPRFGADPLGCVRCAVHSAPARAAARCRRGRGR